MRQKAVLAIQFVDAHAKLIVGTANITDARTSDLYEFRFLVSDDGRGARRAGQCGDFPEHLARPEANVFVLLQDLLQVREQHTDFLGFQNLGILAPLALVAGRTAGFRKWIVRPQLSQRRENAFSLNFQAAK